MKAITISLTDKEIRYLNRILPGFHTESGDSIYNKIQHQIRKNWNLEKGDLIVYHKNDMGGYDCWGFIDSFDYEDDDAARFSLGKSGVIYTNFAPGLHKGDYRKANLQELNKIFDEIYHYCMKSSPYAPWGRIDNLLPLWASKRFYERFYKRLNR